MSYQLLNIAVPAILGLLCFFIKSERKNLMRFLGVYFLITSMGEITGWIIDVYYPDAVSLFFYDKLFIPFQNLLAFAFFAIAFRQRQYKMGTILFAAIYFICFLIEKFIVKYKSQELSYYSYCIDSIFIMIICLLYLVSMVKSAAILNYKKDIIFWFSAGTLFFQLFTFPFFALIDLWFTYPDIGNTYFYFTIYCIHISYLFYTAGLICLKLK